MDFYPNSKAEPSNADVTWFSTTGTGEDVTWLSINVTVRVNIARLSTTVVTGVEVTGFLTTGTGTTDANVVGF